MALLLRLPALFLPAIHHADELWQYVEPANHLLGRPWVATWEYRAGARSWLLPTLFAGPLWASRTLVPALPAMWLPRLPCLLLSLGIVWAAWELGGRVSRRHALIAAFVAATWFEFVYFGARTLSEPIAVALIFLGATALRRRHVGWSVLAGALLAVACLVRVQYAPAVAAVALVELRGDWRRWSAALAGAVAASTVAMLPDLVITGAPLRWLARNYAANLIENRSAGYGTEGPLWYVASLGRLWLVFAVPILALAAVGARRCPSLAAAALVNLAVHMLIAHKEYRFILLSTTLLVFLAALGSVDAMRRHAKGDRWMPPLAAAWFLASVTCGAAGLLAPGWGYDAWLARDWGRIGRRPDLCGVAVYRPRDTLVASYALLGRDVPIYQFDAASAATGRQSRAFNSAVTVRRHASELPGFRTVSCGKYDICLVERPGGCRGSTTDAAFEVNRVMAAAKF